MKKKSHTGNGGVAPLVCAACHTIVGVVNMTEFWRMVLHGDVYLCSTCSAADIDATTAALLESEGVRIWKNLTLAEMQRSSAPLPVVAHEHAVRYLGAGEVR